MSEPNWWQLPEWEEYGRRIMLRPDLDLVLTVITLNPKQLEVLKLRREGLVYREIGERIGVSAGRAVQIMNVVERKLRHPDLHPTKLQETIYRKASRVYTGVKQHQLNEIALNLENIAKQIRKLLD
jgi:hypothetical protein